MPLTPEESDQLRELAFAPLSERGAERWNRWKSFTDYLESLTTDR